VIKNRFVDVLVLSGSLLFHDLHETLGRYHFQAHPSMTDAELDSAQISRMWDLLASDEEYREANEWVGGFTNQLDQSRPYSTREFLHLLGRELAEIATEDGVMTSAYKARVPIFCPGVADSGIAIGILALVVVGSLAERLQTIVARSSSLNTNAIFAIASGADRLGADAEAQLLRAARTISGFAGVRAVVPHLAGVPLS